MTTSAPGSQFALFLAIMRANEGVNSAAG